MDEEFIEIPYQELSSDVLKGIIEEFILREGTEYGSAEFSLEQKVAQVKDQLTSGKVVVVFNPQEESCNIVVASTLNKSSR